MQQKNDPASSSSNGIDFQKKVWITVAIVAFVAIMLLLIRSTFDALLLVLAGSLIAIFFRAISAKIQRKTKWKENICVGISIGSTLLVMAGLFWLIGAKVQEQVTELVDTLPKNIEDAKARLNESSIGKKLVEQTSSGNSTQQTQSMVPKFFKSTFGVLGDLYVVLFIGIFFTISPQTYVKGFVQLIPPQGQKKAAQLMDKLGEELRKWLKGTLISMLIVAVLTAIGLVILGMPLWLVLAILAGLICFIPNFGPILALIPAVLIALSESSQTAMLVVGLYFLIQLIETNFITTAIQKKLINMPPAIILIGQLFMGVLSGAWGVILATPLMVIIMVVVQELYLKNRSKKPKTSDET